MNIHAINFIIGLFIGLFALLNFPLPAIIDKWLFVLLGVYLALSSYYRLNRMQKKRALNETQENP